MKLRPQRLFALVVSAVILATVAAGCGGDGSANRCAPVTASVATAWNEAALDAIRRDFPAPTVHARNLYHLSAAMWDAWAAFDADAAGQFVDAERASDDIANARNVAISFAAHRLLSARYENADGGEESLAQFDQTLDDLCPGWTEPRGDSDGAFGITLADTILAETRDDGSNEAGGYLDPNYQPVNEELVVSDSGTVMADPNRWQPLFLDEQVTRNGLQQEAGAQTFIGSQWGSVTPFAIDLASGDLDPGPPPLLPDDANQFAIDATEVVLFSALLDTTSGEMIDISPAAIGNVELGTYESSGWDVNPETGDPYRPNVVPHADYGRVVAEFWADGPDSETPPGHWNTLANEVGNDLEEMGALTIDGVSADRLEWDVKMGVALNGALHDTAIAVWGTKAQYDYVRPISMIRLLGQQGDLVETPGLVETITTESSMPGERHSGLAEFVGEQAIFAWLGAPPTPSAQLGGVGWQRAADWVPYQQPSFVSPAFAAYVSGHSGFSRAAAEVLTELTGSAYFPGGMETHEVEFRSLGHEVGPTTEFSLQWATYRDAADEAGVSRLYGGIHVRSDDLAGRVMGEQVGLVAVERARTLFSR